ncbi:hypothetical protein RvY_13871 [Ramazzottius varieornatus]|uniref:Uncharacterized protein n=1 Tax=Ramazzottius varieornatus TaxID=947166 RepID=A0A1D1VPD3_RAMVA|nr:hypothetical protein RvY_13871 [Ramazzottius varieornatus]
MTTEDSTVPEMHGSHPSKTEAVFLALLEDIRRSAALTKDQIFNCWRLEIV